MGASEGEPEQGTQVLLDRLVASDIQMFDLQDAEHHTVVSSIEAASIQFSVVQINWLKIWMVLDGMVTHQVIL
jgi:hypothetical protein